MAVIKNKKTNTYEVRTYYKDWTGARKQKTKRGFKRKCDAQDWERDFKLKENRSLDMTFGDFVNIYLNDIKPRIKYNTWLTKKHIVDKKILPYFTDRKLQEIKTADIRQWQNTIMNHRDANGKGYSQVYLKTIHNQMSAILNHAVNFYDLKSNVARKAGSMGKEKSKEMLFWTKEEYMKFIEAVADKYNAEKSDHRIAVVTFGTNASTLMDWTLVTPAETDTAESPSGETALKAKINGLPSEPEGATNVADGMRSAQALMQGDSGYTGTNTKRQKVVILFTDGVPTKQSDFDTTVANGAIQSAKALKDAGATVYSVGIFNGANPEQLYGDSGFKYNSNGQVGSYWASFSWWGIGDVKNYDIPAGNRFLNYISGNFPDATEIGIQRYDSSFIGIGNYGWQITRNFAREQSNYYLTANDSASLSKIFTTISENIGSANIDLGSETVIKDIVTPYFTVPQNAGAIRLSTAAYNGSAFGAPVAADPSVTAAIDPATRAVNVTGFDFNQNYVSTNAKADGTFGKKLIIEFDVSVRDGFLGGNQVPTNDGQSGIYAKGTMIKAFDVPTQDVEVKSITPTADDKAIYLGDSANLQELVHQNATFDGTNNAFVDVTYTVKDENGTVVGTYTVPAGSSSGTWVWSDPASNGTVAPEQTTTYKVTCTVSPTQTGTYESVSKDTTFTITVNTCSLTITKTVTGGGDPNQTFVFNVMKGNDLVTTVVLKAGASTTITGLAVGDYTVVEDTAWSWSYTADNVSTAVTLSSTNPNDEAKITNTYVKHDWLTSIVDVINKWTANDGKTTINNSDRVPGAN